MARNTTSITNPKTKSQNTTSNTSHPLGANASSRSPMGSKTAGTQKPAQKSASPVGKGCGHGASNTRGKQHTEASAEFCPLKDVDIVSDILGGQKALMKLYTTAICETDCTRLRTILNTQLTEAATDQYDSFLYMNQRGMYPTEQAGTPKVKKAIKQFTQKSSAFKS